MTTASTVYQQLTWERLYSAYFRRMSDKEAEDWELIIKDEIKNVKSDELVSAIKRLRKKPLDRNPNVDDVIREIKTIRREAYIANNPPQQHCELCWNVGWLRYYEDVKTHQIFSGDRHYFYSIPCQCSLGQRKLKTHYKQEDWDYINQKSKAVISYITTHPDWQEEYYKKYVEPNRVVFVEKKEEDELADTTLPF